MKYCLIDLLKYPDKEIVERAEALIRFGFPANSVFEIILKQVIIK